MKNKIISKKQFLNLNKISAVKMKKDQILCKKALDVLIKADKYRWLHQTSWLGEPILNLPEDIFILQEIIWRTKPQYIIETGVAWGGSLLFNSLLLDYIGGKKVIGIDIFIPKKIRQNLNKHKKISKKIELIKGSSVEKNVIKKVKSIIKNSKRVLVILDSDHTHDHVLKELEIYSRFVKKNQYLICGDTIVNNIPKQKHRPRKWGPNNNPGTALNYFMKKNPNKFKIDLNIFNKLLFSTQPKGYLIAKK